MLKQTQDNFEKQKKLLNSHIALAAQTKGSTKKTRSSKDGPGVSGPIPLGRKSTKGGGSDSNSNSRASTPVGDRVPPSRQVPYYFTKYRLNNIHRGIVFYSCLLL